MKERPGIMPDRLTLLLCLTNPIFLNFHFVIPQILFHAGAGHTQPHIDLPTLLLPMFLLKILAPLLLYVGCNPYFPAVKSISFLYRHLKFLCHLPVKCSQVQIGIKCIYRLLFHFPDSSLHLLLSFSQYRPSLTRPAFRTVKGSCRIHPVILYIDRIRREFPRHQAV